MSRFSFADANGLTKFVDSADYTYTGTWSGTGTYAANRLDVVTYNTTLYICTRDNIGDNPRRIPTRSRPGNWSVVSQIGTNSEVPVETFWTGTVAIWIATDRPGEYQTAFH